jgi:hypothetical protein
MWLRELADVEPRPVPGTQNAGNLFWSPDGRRIGFVKDYDIRVVDRAGGPAQTVAAADRDTGVYTFGPPSWASDGSIFFSPGNGARLLRVSAEGGEPVEVRAGVTISPSVLADGEKFLYFGGGMIEGSGELFIGSLKTGRATRIEGVRSRAEYAAGHLFYWDQGALVARRFDPEGARFTGAPVSLGEMPGAVFARTGMAVFSVARESGAVAYAKAVKSEQLKWLDKSGNESGRLGEPGSFESFRISPQGDRGCRGRG